MTENIVLNGIIPIKVRIACWNVLADCYSIGQTTKHLSDLDWKFRKEKIKNLLINSRADILCLQEIDHYEDFYRPFLEEFGMKAMYFLRPSREDGCLVAYKSALYDCHQVDYISFDELSASMTSRLHLSSASSYYDRFLKHNVAVSLKLSSKDDPNKLFIVSCGHIYWNPNKPEVKLAQTVYWLNRLQKFSSQSIGESAFDFLPVIIAGDFNSLPSSEPYRYIHDGVPVFSAMSSIEYIHSVTNGYKNGHQARFICDSTLGKLCRWMRALGIDVAIDKEFSQSKSSTNRDYADFFDRAKRENRVILTTSRTMRERAACPRSSLINTVRLEDSLVDLCREYSIKLERERILTVCGKCGGEIESCDRADARFLGKHIPDDRPVFICIECNQPYWWNDKEDSSPARAMKVADRLFDYVSTKLAHDDDIYVDQDNSITPSESRKDVVIEPNTSHDIVDDVSIDVHIAESSKLDNMFDLRNKTVISRKLITSESSSSRSNTPIVYDQISTSSTPVDVSPRLHSDDIDINLHDVDSSSYMVAAMAESVRWKFRSVYEAVHGKEPECTNWSGDFFGTLDYIFASSAWKIHQASCYPITADDEKPRDVNDHIIYGREPVEIESILVNESQPSSIWPSDHFMLVTDLEFD